jgi:hypothetical protein
MVRITASPDGGELPDREPVAVEARGETAEHQDVGRERDRAAEHQRVAAANLQPLQRQQRKPGRRQ